MGGLEDTMPQRATRSKTQYQYLQAPVATKAPVPVPAPAAASAVFPEKPAATTPKTATTTTTTTTTTTKAALPTPAPMKRTLSAGQRSGQPEVAMLRPAAERALRPVVRASPRGPAQRPAIHHQGGVDEIRNLLRVQDTMGPRTAVSTRQASLGTRPLTAPTTGARPTQPAARPRRPRSRPRLRPAMGPRRGG